MLMPATEFPGRYKRSDNLANPGTVPWCPTCVDISHSQAGCADLRVAHSTRLRRTWRLSWPAALGCMTSGSWTALHVCQQGWLHMWLGDPKAHLQALLASSPALHDLGLLVQQAVPALGRAQARHVGVQVLQQVRLRPLHLQHTTDAHRREHCQRAQVQYMHLTPS